MTKPDPQAAGESGHEPIVASKARAKPGAKAQPAAQAKSGAPPDPGGRPAVTGSAPRGTEPPVDGADRELRLEDIKSDDDFRRYAAARLAESLDSSVGLIAQAEHLSAAPALPAHDRINPLHAAARLMCANARLAREIARLAQVEHRQRTIVERLQPPVPVSIGSNSTLSDTLGAELCLKMLRYMNVVAADAFDGAIKDATAPSENDMRKDDGLQEARPAPAPG